MPLSVAAGKFSQVDKIYFLKVSLGLRNVSNHNTVMDEIVGLIEKHEYHHTDDFI